MTDPIQNADRLTAREVAGKRVMCPACSDKIFEKWPSGWSSHAAYKCAGLEAIGIEGRKHEFRHRFERLFSHPSKTHRARSRGVHSGSRTPDEEVAPLRRRLNTTSTNLPELVVHADWGIDPGKRWAASALWNGKAYAVDRSFLVEDAHTFLHDIHHRIGDRAKALVGFDFPIGVPAAYAQLAQISNFLEWLPNVGRGKWQEFLSVCEARHEIDLNRPFYPYRPGGTRQQHLVDGLGLEMVSLRRQCEHAHPGRKAAAPLFWTLGPNQVGKAAISGWEEVLIPALRNRGLDVSIWPFSGPLHETLLPGRTVVCETYPAEFYDHLGVEFGRCPSDGKSGKLVQSDRAANADALIDFSHKVGASISLSGEREMREGYGHRADGEDRFDAVVGLLGMMNVLMGNRSTGEPTEDSILNIEGWIFGQRSDAALQP